MNDMQDVAEGSLGEGSGKEDGWLDTWVGERPVWTFVLVAVLAALIFVALYWLIGLSGFEVGYELNDLVTNYVGALVTTVVALAGALVSVMLARLALKLGHKAKAAAEQANEIQRQMRALTERQGDEAKLAADQANAIQEQMRALTERQGDEAKFAADQANAIQEQMRAVTERQGEEAKLAADKANTIQEQMRKFGDPRLAETREGHKAAASLDLLGTLLRVYSAQAFSSTSMSPPPIEAIRHTYKRANDLVSDPDLYRYCAQLIGTATTADTFASIQSLIYESTMSLARGGEPGYKDRIGMARNAEEVAVRIAALSRMLEEAKRAVLADPGHKLHQLAFDLDWTDAVGGVSGCDNTARSDLMKYRGGKGVGAVVFEHGERAAHAAVADGDSVPLGSLLEKGKRSVIHVLETDLQELILRIRQAANGAAVRIHQSLRDYAAACYEGANSDCIDVIVARWDSSLEDDPRTVSCSLRNPPEKRAGETVFALGMQSVWDKAVFITKNPVAGRTIEAAMKDLEFLHKLQEVDVSDALYEHQGIDPADDANQEEVAEEQRLARLSGKRLYYIHAAIEELRKVHARKGFVTVPDFDPYEQLAHGDYAIVVVRPYFARIDMSARHSEWEMQNQWFEDRVGSYLNFRWDGGRP